MRELWELARTYDSESSSIAEYFTMDFICGTKVKNCDIKGFTYISDSKWHDLSYSSSVVMGDSMSTN